MRGTDPALALSHVTKRFGGTLALDDVSFALARGTVHSLLGENGAGKTTLMNIAFGLTRADAATMLVAGEPCRVSSPAEAIRAGIGMVHQHFTNVGAMTVAENVALGGRGGYDAGRAAATVAAVGARAGLSLDPLARADSLPVGAQQRLEIVKALARGARILILDEPTAVLAPAESEELLRWLRTFADEGNSVVLITHKLRDALSVADEVTVLRRGRVVHTGQAAGLSAERLATMLVGQSERDPRMATELGGPLPSEPARERAASVGDVIASMSHIELADERGVTSVRDLTFEVRAGELVGVAAVEGAGHRELLRALAGRLRPASGQLRLPSRIAFVPEDRHRDAMVTEFTLAENVALKGAGARRGRISWREQRERATTLVREFDVRGGGASAAARTLSGGNQQKLVLARELDGAPQLVVAENPTRGLDVHASAAVHERLARAAHSGAAGVVYSSDLDEVLAVATRVVVMHAGRLLETPLDRDSVGRAMLGVA
ncbi:MAG TPA: ATP-binding cassette domain-containing protein [Gemmatimonadaceae bacterium]|nr:ATP-binding cassette domain-containing protein [Gemmatimonadaceae bacterium]